MRFPYVYIHDKYKDVDSVGKWSYFLDISYSAYQKTFNHTLRIGNGIEEMDKELLFDSLFTDMEYAVVGFSIKIPTNVAREAAILGSDIKGKDTGIDVAMFFEKEDAFIEQWLEIYYLQAEPDVAEISSLNTEIAEGIVADHVEVTGTALEMAKYFLKKQLSEMQKNGYVNWKIEDFAEEYVYETGQIKEDTKVTVYKLTYCFLAKEPDSVALTESVSLDEDGWVTSAEWEGIYFCVVADGGLSYMILSEDEYTPGEDGFALSLKKTLDLD